MVPGVRLSALGPKGLPSLASWVKLQSWANGSSLLVLVVVASGLYIAATLFFKSAGKRLWQWLTGKLAATSTPDKPLTGCYPLNTLANELFPQLGAGSPSLNFVGREAEQQWLSTQCTSAKTTGGIRVISLWGPQGIGKTHLAFVFARALSKGDYVSLGRWITYRLAKEFDPQDVIETLPAKPVLLLDEVSLADDTSHRRLQKMIRTASSRKSPLLVLLTAWQPRHTEGLSQSEKLVGAELEVKPLEDHFARQLYENANQLRAVLRGHPLMLRLLQQKPSDTGAAESQPDLRSACLAWAAGFAARLRKDYAMSDRAMQAFAAASASDAITWASLSSVFKLDAADFQAIKKTGRITERQGALSVTPLRPDLLGWAFAIQVFQAINSQALKPRSSLAWEADFFDTGRFLQFATTMGKQRHPWVEALHAPPAQPVPAVARAKVATNAVSDYGSAQNWDAMAAELLVSGAIAQRFPSNAEIQLRRTRCLLAQTSSFYNLD